MARARDRAGASATPTARRTRRHPSRWRRWWRAPTMAGARGSDTGTVHGERHGPPPRWCAPHQPRLDQLNVLRAPRGTTPDNWMGGTMAARRSRARYRAGFCDRSAGASSRATGRRGPSSITTLRRSRPNARARCAPSCSSRHRSRRRSGGWRRTRGFNAPAAEAARPELWQALLRRARAVALGRTLLPPGVRRPRSAAQVEGGDGLPDPASVLLPPAARGATTARRSRGRSWC